MNKFILTILFFCTNILYANIIAIDDTTEQLEILTSSQIYIDKTKKLTIDDIFHKDSEFHDNDKELLSYGYSPDFDVWVKFTLKNTSDKPIQKILEYVNSLTTDIVFYDLKKNISYQDGLLNTPSTRSSVNPIFEITLNPNEANTYYIKASSYVTTMIIKLKLWNHNIFYGKELKHQVVLALFFGAMVILAIYNLFIFLFSRDLSYLYYVFYLGGILSHHLIYVGIGQIYLYSQETILLIISYSSFLVSIPAIALAVFTKSFIKMNQYKKLNKILSIIILLVFLNAICFLYIKDFPQYRNLLPFILLVCLMAITLYAVIKNNRQAKFILIGWVIFLTSGMLMYLSSLGSIHLLNKFSYYVEIMLLFEAILFSVALSDKINTLKTKLIIQKKTENERLELQVKEKTKDLNLSLEEKTLLLQELNHRVKNNMQMIVSLIRLQTDGIDDKKIQALFLTTQNRLNAMSELHELLYQKEDISYINAYEYFSTLIEGLQETYTQDVLINYTIDTDLQTEQAISCGIILNELVTNCLKYAFYDEKCDDRYIDVCLTKLQDKYTLIVKDNGVGYDQQKIKKSFGLILVTTLVESKLQGSISIDTKYGVETIIIWSEENEED